jgi:DNA topoisomerase-2
MILEHKREYSKLLDKNMLLTDVKSKTIEELKKSNENQVSLLSKQNQELSNKWTNEKELKQKLSIELELMKNTNKKLLEEKKEILKFVNNNTDEDVNFRITLDGKKSDGWTDKELIQKFKLIKKISITNMHLYDKEDKIKKYHNVNDILREFYHIRLEAYTTRKNYYLEKYQKELDTLNWKMKFIMDVLEDKIVINRKKRDDIVAQLVKKKYPNLGDEKYDYLLNLPIHSFTYEKIEELKEKIENKQEEIDLLDSKTEKEIWMDELDEFKEVYIKEYQPTDTNVTMCKPTVKQNLKATKDVIEKNKKIASEKAAKKVVAKKPAVKKTTKK